MSVARPFSSTTVTERISHSSSPNFPYTSSLPSNPAPSLLFSGEGMMLK